MSIKQNLPAKTDWVIGDFNSMLETDLLCLSHTSNVQTSDGRRVELAAGMHMTAFDEDADDSGRRDDIFASGLVEPSPEYAQCRGSVWCLRIDANGVRHESEIENAWAVFKVC